MVEHELSLDEKTFLLTQFDFEEKKLNSNNPIEDNLELLKEMEKLIGVANDNYLQQGHA